MTTKKTKEIRSMTNKKNVKLAKEEAINVRCTSEQKELLEEIAAYTGVGVSTWLLQVGLRAARTEQDQRTARGEGR